MTRSAILLGSLLALSMPGRSEVQITFDEMVNGFPVLTDGQLVGKTYFNNIVGFFNYGVIFTNATVETEGISLSPLFPPASGENVAVDLPNDPMIITFTKKVNYFSARFTWTAPLFFDITYAKGPDGTDSSILQYGARIGTANFIGAGAVGGGGPQNLPFTFQDPFGIKSIDIWTIPGDQTGDTFTIDSLILRTTPEPREIIPIAGGLVFLLLAVAKRRPPCTTACR
jgi:hypothetical protein